MSGPLDSAFGFRFTVDPGMVRGSTDDVPVAGSNQAVFARVRDAGYISKIGLWVTASSGNISVGVYRNTGSGRSALPGTRVGTSGAVACPSTGYQEVALTSACQVFAGDWLAISADNVTAKFRGLLGAQADNDLGKGRQCRMSTAHPLPSTPSSLVATIGWTIVLVGVR